MIAWPPRRGQWRIAVARRHRSRTRGRTRPRKVARQRWGRCAGPPDVWSSGCCPQRETGRGVEPADDRRVVCVVSSARSSCTLRYPWRYHREMCCHPDTSGQHPMSHRRSRSCRSEISRADARSPAPPPSHLPPDPVQAAVSAPTPRPAANTTSTGHRRGQTGRSRHAQTSWPDPIQLGASVRHPGELDPASGNARMAMRITACL